MPEIRPLEKVTHLDERVIKAKNSAQELEQLLSDFTPYMHRCAARYSPNNDSYMRDELFGIAMTAFYEAVRDFDVKRGHFFPLVERVVRQNIIDYLRKSLKYDERMVSLDNSDSEKQSIALDEISTHHYEKTRRQEDMAAEIEQFKIELAQWNITMDALVKQSPKHKRVAEEYKSLVEQISKNPDIVQTIKLKHYFPIKKISQISKLPQKKLEYARTFIIASLIIKLGDYDYLSEYVK